MKQSEALDRKILKGLPEHYFTAAAAEIRLQLPPAAIKQAFMQYPHVIYQLTGRRHEEILASRLLQLPGVAKEFYQLVNDD